MPEFVSAVIQHAVILSGKHAVTLLVVACNSIKLMIISINANIGYKSCLFSYNGVTASKDLRARVGLKASTSPSSPTKKHPEHFVC
jgi:hypothetical protein